MGLSYLETITMPVRVIGILLDESARRNSRISSTAKKSKAMGVVDLMEID